MSVVDDWALLEFASVVDAATCAIEIQRQIRERNGSKAGWCIGICIGMSAHERLSVIFTMLNGPLAIDVRERDLPSPRGEMRAHFQSLPMRAIAPTRKPRLLPTKMPATNHRPPVPRKVHCPAACQSMMDFMVGNDNRHPPTLGGLIPERSQSLDNQESALPKQEKHFRTGKTNL